MTIEHVLGNFVENIKRGNMKETLQVK